MVDRPAEQKSVTSHSLVKHPSFYDYLKHLTTLATGSIVLLATFAKTFPATSSWRWRLRIAMATFLLSVLCSLVSMFLTLSCQRRDDHAVPEWEARSLVATFLLSVAALFVGVLCIALFSIRNF
jgi:cytochrome bd-type quinol oxidase subunit 1